MADAIDFDKVRIQRLGKTTPGVSSFTNQKESMVVHLQRDALDEQKRRMGTTWVWIHNDSVALGYVSLAMSSIDRKDVQNNSYYTEMEKFPYSTIPVLLIGQLATNKEYEGKGVGTSMISWSIKTAVRLSSKVGCRMIALHPHDDVIDWYEKRQFKRITRARGQTMMYLDLLVTA